MDKEKQLMITEIWGTSKFKDVLSKEAQPRQFPEMNNVIREFIRLHLNSQLTKSTRICASFNNALHITQFQFFYICFFSFLFIVRCLITMKKVIIESKER